METRFLAFAFMSLALLSSFAFADVPITSCSAPNLANTRYYMTENISAPGGSDCLYVEANNVTIDCQGFSVIATDGGGNGIYSNQNDTTIENCRIANFSEGALFVGANYGTIANTTLTGETTHGVYLDNFATNNQIYNVSVLASANGIALDRGSDNNIVSDSIVDVDSVGLYAGYGPDTPSDNNQFLNNTVTTVSNAALYTYSSNNNTFLENNLTSDNWVSDDSGGNYYNDSTVGNKYYFANGSGAWTVYPTFTTAPPGYANSVIGSYIPYSQATAGSEWPNAGEDYHPWTELAAAPFIFNSISLSPSTPSASSDLSCVVSVYNSFGNSNVSYEWYKNGVNQSLLAGTYVDLPSEAATSISTVGSGNLTVGDEWYCSADVQYNGTNSSGWQNTSIGTVTPCGNITSPNTVVTLNSDITGVGFDPYVCFYVQTNNVTIDCNGYTIGGSFGNAIVSTANNTTIENCNIDGTSFDWDGIFLGDYGAAGITTEGATLNDNTIITSGPGVDLDNATFSTISNSTITSLAYNGIDLYDSSDNNTIFNTTINTTGHVGIYMAGGGNGISSGNTVLHNNITGSMWIEDDAGGNYYNDSASGNIYYLQDGTPSWDFYNITASSGTWADAGTNYPFNASTVSEWDGFGTDWHPYTLTSTPIPPAFHLNVFYDVSGHLWSAYYDSNTSKMNITQVNGPTTLIATNYTNGFGAVIRPDILMTFNNDSAVFYNYTNGTSATVSFPYGIQPNGFYDSYAFAYTKQYDPLATDDDSYYLIMANNNTNSMLLKVNSSLGISIINSSEVPVAWPSLAESSDLYDWYYAFPESCGGNTYKISIFSYSGTAASKVANPDSTCYSNDSLSNAKVMFETDGGANYFVQFNTTGKTVIYRLNDGMQSTLSYTMQSISPFIFYDANNFVFYSSESGNTYVYSCYFGSTASCIRNSLSDYGGTGLTVQANGVTTAGNNTTDVVAYGYATSVNPVILAYKFKIMDVKLVCNDEVDFTELPSNYRIFTSSNSVVMASGATTWEYATSSSDLGIGTRRIYSFCTDGSNRQYFVNATSLDQHAYSLNASLGEYYAFKITDCYNLAINDVLSTAQRYISTLGIWDTVEQSLSQVDGTATLFLEPNTPYTLIFNSTGRNTTTTSFSPSANATSVAIQLGCAGENISTQPTYESQFNDLEYWISPKNNFVSNTSVPIIMTAYSPTGRIISTNWVITQIPTGTANISSYSGKVVYNVTSTNRFGLNATYITPANYPAIYDVLGTIVNVNSNINNVNGTYNLTSSLYQVQVFARSSVAITPFTASVQGLINTLRLGNAFSGWAWLFVATVCTALTIGYVSRFTLDGAGIIGAAMFSTFSLINNASVLIPGWGTITMIMISIVSFLMVFAIIAWRYI